MEDEKVIFMLGGIIDKLIACLAPDKLAEYESKKMEHTLTLHKLMNKDKVELENGR